MRALLLLFVVATLSIGCKKERKASFPEGSQYTSRMGGTRNWHGTEDYNGHNPYGWGTDTSWHISTNMSFAINVINDTTIEIWNNYSAFFKSLDKNSNTISFYAQGGDLYTLSVIYYYLTDSIDCHIYQFIGAETIRDDQLSSP